MGKSTLGFMDKYGTLTVGQAINLNLSHKEDDSVRHSKIGKRLESPLPLWYMEKDGRKLSRHAKQYVREVDGLKIIFWSKDTIYVLGRGEQVMITRWYDTYGTYRRWFNLSRALKRRASLTMTEVYSLARRYQFQLSGLRYSPPEVEKIANIEVIKEYPW